MVGVGGVVPVSEFAKSMDFEITWCVGVVTTAVFADHTAGVDRGRTSTTTTECCGVMTTATPGVLNFVMGWVAVPDPDTVQRPVGMLGLLFFVFLCICKLKVYTSC
jgi:hypothetical protein